MPLDGSGRSEKLLQLAKRIRLENRNQNPDANVTVSNSRAHESQSAAEPIERNRAAVLICLFEDESGDLRVILTRRSSKLSSHSGEVALPGGKRGENDSDDAATALREAHEEIGLDPSMVEIVAALEPFHTRMSGDGEGNYGGSGSGGWDLNSFGDWENMINTLGGGGSSTLGTQGSATPGGYQPPNFDLDAYVRPNVPRFSQGLSQIREDFPVDPTPGVGRGGGSGRGGGGGRGSVQPQTSEDEEEEEEEDLGRHPYNNLETMAVYNAWITVSYDPIVGNQQTRKCFWEKVVEVYHQIKPNRSRKRTVKAELV